ncbi:MAG: diguanylate cyclase, partial [Lachnospiraceae bacterium]|nr:diguanylate cyclase [Lachnospiraceae bacterium]
LYIVDGAYEDACPPGVVDSFEDGIWPDKDNPVVKSTITNEDVYGWLVTAAYPVMKDGEVITHVCVDISMNAIKERENRYFVVTVLAMVALTAGMLAFSIWYFNSRVINPVRKLSDTAKNYCSESNSMEHHAFEKLTRKSNDEIGHLLSSMKQMEADMNANIKEVIDTRVALKASQELASKDALTGVRNKTAYDYEVKNLEEEMEAGDCEFGLAMVDLNFLKKINDTYGHEKGNISIKRLCSLVCEIFEHSPVFRVGGDEFVVILRNSDYKNADRLIRKFNDRLEQIESDSMLQPWEKISAAIGYHKYNKNVDRNIEVVFKKADDAMYKRKALMKAERKE